MTSRSYPQPHPEIGVELVREWESVSEPKGVIVIVHGIAEHCGRYERTGQLLAEAGFHVRSFDLIGAGASGGARWDIDKWSRYHDQVQRHVEAARERGVPVVLFGHSLGGNIAAGYVLDGYPAPDLLVLSAPALDGGAAWQRALAPIAGKLAPRMSLSNAVKGEHLSRDPQVAEDYFADPLVVTKSSFRFGAQLFEQMEEVSSKLDQLDVPTLVIHGGDDVLVPTESSEQLGRLDCVDRKVYPGLRHETLNEPEGPEIVSDIVDWIEEHLNAS